MPTVKHRYQVTETPSLAHALEVAAQRWPGKSKSALIAELVERGVRELERENHDAIEERRKLVESLAGGFHYPEGYLEELRKDWPE